MATEYPEIDVWGYDISESVVRQNCDQYSSHENLSFAAASLPDPKIEHRFEFVYCYATLQYVRDVERAICDLYGLVEPGGFLVFDYPNQELCETYRDGIEPGTPVYRRFKLVCNGVNELSQDRISGLLGTAVHDYWDLVDAPDDVHGAFSWYPCVCAQKSPK